MLNLELGSRADISGKARILTRKGAEGHAVYGPYLDIQPGHYVVEFNIAAAEDQPLDGDFVCAKVDIVSDAGRRTHASEKVRLSRLRGGPASIRLPFHTDAAHTFEFRVATTGKAQLIIDEYCRVVPLEDARTDYAALLEATKFPDASEGAMPAFFVANEVHLRRLYERGAIVRIVDGGTVITIDGVSFHASQLDDIRFVRDIFFDNCYNFLIKNECCVIDIGMNIGLASLTFARKSVVREVHSFEPFSGTYARACANLALNPEISGKISANNYGLADADQTTTILISNDSDSGALSIRGSAEGKPEPIVVRDAAAVLGPIIEAARAKRRDVIAKVDCEGSEYAIFERLAQCGLLFSISAFMVEWHRAADGQNQHSLIDPLVRNGFVVFDLTGLVGNGFFYAVRQAHASS